MEREQWLHELAYFDTNLFAIESAGTLAIHAKILADTQDDHMHEFADDWWQGEMMYRVTNNWNPPR